MLKLRAAVPGFIFSVTLIPVCSLKQRQHSFFQWCSRDWMLSFVTCHGSFRQRTCLTGVVTSFWFLWWGSNVHVIHVWLLSAVYGVDLMLCHWARWGECARQCGCIMLWTVLLVNFTWRHCCRHVSFSMELPWMDEQLWPNVELYVEHSANDTTSGSHSSGPILQWRS